MAENNIVYGQGQTTAPGKIQRLVDAAKEQLGAKGLGVDRNAARLSIEEYSTQPGSESNTAVVNELTKLMQTFGKLSLEDNVRADQSHVLSSRYSNMRQMAAVQGALRASAGKAVVERSLNLQHFNVDNGVDVVEGPARARQVVRMKQALEAYDQKENANVAALSYAYNLEAPQQIPLVDMFFPMFLVPAEQLGLLQTIRLIHVYRETKHTLEAEVVDPLKDNVIHANIDPAITRTELTKVVPVWREKTKQFFLDVADETPSEYKRPDSEEVFQTSTLKCGVEINLLALSQTDEDLSRGTRNQSDALDAAIKLTHLTYKIGTGADAETIRVSTHLASQTFVQAAHGDYRDMNLNFNSDAVIIPPTQRTADGEESVILKPLADQGYTVVLRARASGLVNLQFSTTNVYGAEVRVLRIVDKNGADVTIDAALQSVIDQIEGRQPTGFRLELNRTNSNVRDRGLMLNTTFRRQVWAIPLLQPISVTHPQHNTVIDEAADLASLIYTTHVQASNAGIDKLQEDVNFLRLTVKNPIRPQGDPGALGLARLIVNPWFEEVDLDVKTIVKNRRTAEIMEDVRATVLTRLEEMAYRAYRETGWRVAVDSQYGPNSEVPLVLIGTDRYLEKFLWKSGDQRIMGNIKYRVESCDNYLMRDTILFSFGLENPLDGGQPKLMHYGVFAWKPELVFNLPLHRAGENSRELTVQPSYLHITNLPILGVIRVKGIQEAIASKATDAFDPLQSTMKIESSETEPVFMQTVTP